MKNNNMKFWIIVIIIALIAGFVGAFISSGITGNVIKVPDSAKTNDVYTKAEVDNIIANIPGKLANTIDVLNITKRLYTKDIVYKETLFGGYINPDFYGKGKPKTYSVTVGSSQIGVGSFGSDPTINSRSLASIKDYQISVETPDGSAFMNSNNLVLNKNSNQAVYSSDLIQMKSKNGIVWYCRPNNNGIWNCSNSLNA